MILCDTNILIEFYKNNEQIIVELRQIGVDSLAVSAVSVAELYFGALDKSELNQLKQHLASMDQLPLNTAVSKTFLRLMEAYSLGHKLSIPDALIAATAIEHSMPLYTLNVKDFRFIDTLQLHPEA
jgi:tRNA(fMet)-specific endonuclease VapC